MSFLLRGALVLVLGACVVPEAPTLHQAAHDDDVAFYTCPMHPSVHAETPGACPICGMDLVPVPGVSLQSGEVTIDPVRRQEIGVTTARVERREMALPLHAVGSVTYDASAISAVTVRTEGWVEAVFVEPGQRVQRGQPLLSVYSPELYAAQAELLLAREGPFAGPSRERLRALGVADAQVEAVLAAGEPRRGIDVLAPATGFLVETAVVAGDAVTPGEVLFRIGPLDRVWVEAEVYEEDLDRVHAGQAATLTTPDGDVEGRVALVLPSLTAATRTGRVRIELPNPGVRLRPGMFVEVDLQVEAGERLVVPREAVIYTGPRRLVFVDLGEGRLQPREVEIGLRGHDEVEVLSGLTEGDVVVRSGNFLVAAESRLRSATEYWGAP